MNYATQHHIGSYQPAQAETTTAIAPTTGRVCQLDAKKQRCEPGSQRQAEIRTDSHASNGFLKCSFLPKLKMEQSLQACKQKVKTQRDFYKSLSKLSEHYIIEPIQTEPYGYPYNIALAMWDMETQLKNSRTNWDSFKLVQDSSKTFLVSEERYNTGTTLYYIPILPLFKMLHDPNRKKTAQLLLSVCSYLYHIADIPYYRQENTYLYWMYEMMTDWVEQDDETDQNDSCKSELRQAQEVGDCIEQKLFNPINLQVFEQRLNSFKSLDAFDKKCSQIARDAFVLFTEYPTAVIFRNASISEQDPDNDQGDYETIGMEKYISFISDTKGWLYESISESINNEFNEYGAMQEPLICKHFDTSTVTEASLDFESRIFPLLNDLCGVLYEYKIEAK